MELALSESWYYFLLMAVLSYFIGCFNVAVVIAKAKRKDVHKIGSGNPGSMNMSREFGLKIGFLNFMCDVCKGGIPALVSFFIFRGYTFAGTEVLVTDFTRYLCGTFVIIGHIYPVTMKFKGGKGIASTFGLFWFALSMETWWYAGIMLLALLAVLGFIAVTEIGSMGSLLGVSGFSIWQGLIFFVRYGRLGVNGYVIALYVLLLTVNFLTWFAHRKNIVRFFAGEEHRTSVKKLSKGKRGMNNM